MKKKIVECFTACAILLVCLVTHAGPDPSDIRQSIIKTHDLIGDLPLRIEYDMKIQSYEPNGTSFTDHQTLMLHDGKFYHEARGAGDKRVSRYSYDGAGHRSYLSYIDPEGKPVSVGSIGDGKGMQPVRFPISQVYFFPQQVEGKDIVASGGDDDTTITLKWGHDGETAVLFVDPAHGNMPVGTEVHVDGILQAKEIYSEPAEIKAGIYMPGKYESQRFDKSGTLTKSVKYYNVRYAEITPSAVEEAIHFDVPQEALQSAGKKRVPKLN